MIACNRYAVAPEFIDLRGRLAHRARNWAGLNTAASHIDSETRRTQLESYSLTDTATRSSYNRCSFSHETFPLVSDELKLLDVLPPEYSIAKCTD
jgi:hypothetical protein